jgi:hypothetical protein
MTGPLAVSFAVSAQPPARGLTIPPSLLILAHKVIE